MYRFSLKKLDIPQPILILILGGFIQSVGNSFMWPLNSLFMHDVLGRSLTEAGMLMAAQALVTLLGQFVSGILADRFGARRIMLFGLVGAILSVGMIGVFPVWTVYAPGLLFFGLSIAFIFVPLNVLINDLWPEGGRRGFNLLYVFNNAGVAVGTALGGLIAAFSFRLIFLLNALSFFLYLLLVLFIIPKQAQKETLSTQKNQRQSLWHDRGFPVLLTLSGGIFLVWAAYIQLTTVLPVVMTELGFSLPQYSILWTLNGIFIVTLQPIINWTIKHWARSLSHQFYLSCLLIAFAFAILLARLPYPSYILSMLILTLGEMLILPAVPTAAAQIAPEGKVGTYQGITAGASSGGRVLGPLLGGIVFDHFGGQMAWVLALGFMGISFLAFYLYNHKEHIYSKGQSSSL
jgi:MFS family permease